MDDKDNVDDHSIAGGFSSDPTWTFQSDYSYFGSDVRENNVLSEFGWNYPPPPVFDRIGLDVVGTSMSLPEVGAGGVASGVQLRSVDHEAGDVSMSNPLVSSGSSEDRPESSTASGDAAASGGKPPPSERA